MRSNRISFHSGAETVLGILSEPDQKARKLVVLLHGGPGGTKDGPDNLFVQLAERFGTDSVASLRFDFRGSGESDGLSVDTTIQAEVNDLRAATEWVLAKGYSDLGLVGESLGATIALAGYDSRYKALALLWPAIDLMDTSLREFLSPSATAELERTGFVESDGIRVGQGFIDELRTVNMTSRLSRIDAPTLLVHGTADEDVPFAQSQQAKAILGDRADLHLIDGGGHGLREDTHRRTVNQLTADWFLRHL